MSTTLKISPVTRIEGHLEVEVTVESVGGQDQVIDAKASGPMFRGFEAILAGRDPRDAVHYTQRICGVCPISHALASSLALENASMVTPAENGRIMRNLILGANYLQSHILHFYHLAALDFVDVTALTSYTGRDPVLRDLRQWIEKQTAAKVTFPAAPFLPRYEGDYIKDKDVNLGAVRH